MSRLDLRLGEYRVFAQVYRFSQFLCGLRGPRGDSPLVQIVAGRAVEDPCVVVGVRELPYGLCHAQKESVRDEEFGDAGFIKVGSVSAGRPLVQSSREVLDTVFPDAVYRQDPAWSSALTGVPLRSEGWKIRDVMEILAERVNHYYREKESVEFEVETLRARGSAVGEYDRGYKRYRYSEKDDADDERYGAPRDPYDPYADGGGFPSRPNTVYKRRFALWLVESGQQPRDASTIST